MENEEIKEKQEKLDKAANDMKDIGCIAGYDDRVCDECSRLHLLAFTLEKIRGLIPMHPRCRCTFVPIVK